MANMQAVRIHEYGRWNRMGVEVVEQPEMQDDEILLCVHSASINPVLFLC